MSSEASKPSDSLESDELLVGLVKRRDQAAMARLFAAHSGLVYSVAFRILRDQSESEDVLQEVFMQIWRKPPNFLTARGSLRGWLAIISRNRAIDHLRVRKPTDVLEDVALFAPYDPEQDAEHVLMLEKARVVIALLPVEQSKALQMAFFEGLTHVEIAQRTGDPLGTVKTRIRTAIQTLGKVLGHERS